MEERMSETAQHGVQHPVVRLRDGIVRGGSKRA